MPINENENENEHIDRAWEQDVREIGEAYLEQVSDGFYEHIILVVADLPYAKS